LRRTRFEPAIRQSSYRKQYPLNEQPQLGVSTAAGREFYSRNQPETSPEMADLQYISGISVENRFIAILLVCNANSGSIPVAGRNSVKIDRMSVFPG